MQSFWWLTLWEWMSPPREGMFPLCLKYNGNRRKIKTSVISSWNYSSNRPRLPPSTWISLNSLCFLMLPHSPILKTIWVRVWQESRQPSFWKQHLSSWNPWWLANAFQSSNVSKLHSGDIWLYVKGPYAVFNMIHAMAFFQERIDKFKWLPKLLKWRGRKETLIGLLILQYG